MVFEIDQHEEVTAILDEDTTPDWPVLQQATGFVFGRLSMDVDAVFGQ